MSIRKLGTGGFATVLWVMVLGALALPAFASCPNEQAREQSNSTRLPDCRAYEMVSPLEKNGADIEGIGGGDGGAAVQTTPDGDAVTYISPGAFDASKGSPLVNQYISRHGAAGWSTENITEPLRSYTDLGGDGEQYEYFSSDLTQSLLSNGLHNGTVENPPIPGAPAGYHNLYLRNNTNGTLEALLTFIPSEGSDSFFLVPIGATEDLTHILVATSAALTPGATPGEEHNNLYEWVDGQFQVINEPPNPTTPGETLFESTLGSITFGRGEDGPAHTMSADGSRVFWSSIRRPALFVREGIGTLGARSLEIDKPAPGVSEEPNHITLYQTASVDGSRAFFTSTAQLTSNANTGPVNCPGCEYERDGADLYEYVVPNENAVPKGEIIDLTPDSNPSDPLGANVLGVVSASEDGSYIYFAANGVLAPGATPGNCQTPLSGENGAGPGTACNLYLRHNGVTTFIATLSGQDELGVSVGAEANGAHDWSSSVLRRTVRVSPDGRHLLFMSAASLTGYDNRDAVTGEPDEEIYSYESGTPGPVCISCNPTGARPIGPSSIPPGTPFRSVIAEYESRVLSPTGDRVFFQSKDALVPQDTNGQLDVYEWEREGTGSCISSSGVNGGCVSLISGGASSEKSTFLDAGEDGSNVFFLTRQSLVPGDTDQLVDLYDARVEGGQAQVVAPACTGTGCQGLPGAQPTFEAPPSATFNGVGNFPAPAAAKAAPKKTVKCAKGRKLSRGKCVKTKKKSKAKRAKRSASRRGHR